MATGVKPLSGGIQNSLPKRLEGLINEFPGFPTPFFALDGMLVWLVRLLLAKVSGRSGSCAMSVDNFLQLALKKATRT